MPSAPTFRPTAASVIPAATPLPIQRYQVTKEDFEKPERFNVFLSQLTNAVQAVQGSGGPSVLPSGIDVAGATVSGLRSPTSPTDAVSAGHADSNYGAANVGPLLDIGGKHTLKGLTGLQLTSNSQAKTLTGLQTSVTAIQGTLAVGVSGTIPLAKLTGGGANGSITVTGGIISAFVAPT